VPLLEFNVLTWVFHIQLPIHYYLDTGFAFLTLVGICTISVYMIFYCPDLIECDQPSILLVTWNRPTTEIFVVPSEKKVE
jgi:hypothetical protein